MTTMSVSGERVHSENVATYAAGVAWRGKSRMVPMVLLSALLVVTGGAGAQASTDATVINSWGSQQRPVTHYYHVIGKVETTESATKVGLVLTTTAGMQYEFTGHSPGKPGLKAHSATVGGQVETEDLQRLINETKKFKVRKIFDGGYLFNISFHDININGNWLGHLRVFHLEFPGPMAMNQLPFLNDGGVFHSGEWKSKILTEDLRCEPRTRGPYGKLCDR